MTEFKSIISFFVFFTQSLIESYPILFDGACMSFSPFVAYEASAGSGKTYQLTARYIALLLLDQTPESILAVTFTKKAAASMKEKIIDSLQNMDEAMLDIVAKETGLDHSSIMSKLPNVKKRFLSGSPAIYNIDKFFTKVLRSFAFEAGIDPNFSVVSNIDEQAVFETFLQKLDDIDSFVKLFEIEDAKLSNIFTIFDKLYENDPLLPEVTYKEELFASETAVLEAMKPIFDHIHTCEKASKRVKQMVEYDNADEIATKSWLAYESLGEHQNFKKCFIPELDTHFFALKEALLNYIQAKERFILSHLLHYYQLYKQARSSKTKLQFNDITQRVFSLLHSIESDFLYFRLDAKYRHILIDEFQDTSLLQFLIFKPLIDEIFSGHGQREFRSFFYVGDVKQSIYRFRGGQKELFYDVIDHYAMQIRQMDRNFRSRKNVVDFANRYFYFMDGFVPQKAQKEGGITSMQTCGEDSLLEAITEKVEDLLQKGVDSNQIAILTFQNKDAIEIEYALHRLGHRVVTDSSSKLVNNPKVAALISALVYLAYREPLHKEEFLHYCQSSAKEIDIGFTPAMPPLEALKRLIEKYEFFDGNKNVLKFLEIASGYDNIYALLEDDIDESVVVQSMQGIKLMTVHKSKGLEFDYTVVCDRFGSKDAPDNEAILLEQSSAGIERIWYRLAKRSAVDTRYAAMLEKRKDQRRQDLFHTLYVAFTRAVEGLFIIAKEDKSKFEPLNLQPECRGAMPEIPGREEPEPRQPKKVILTNHGRQEQPPRDKRENTFDYAAVLFGNALHYTLQQLSDFSVQSLPAAIACMQNRFGDMIDCAAVETRVRALLRDDTFLQLTRGTVMKEKAIICDKKVKQLDLLVEKENEFVIIDYKSSKQGQASHKSQIIEYMNLIEKASDKKACGYICYLLDDSITLLRVERSSLLEYI